MQWTAGAVTTNLSTTQVSSSELDALVPASLLGSPGYVSVAVRNSDGSTTNALSFSIFPPITSLSPSTRTENNGPFTLLVNGLSFPAGSTVWWDGDFVLSTTFVNSTQLSATVPQNLVTAGPHNVFVQTPQEIASNTVIFTVFPAPIITNLNPASRTATAPGFTLTVSGTDLLPGQTVRWNGTNLTTSIVTPPQAAPYLTATVPTNLLTTAGLVNITVLTADGISSNAATFYVNPAPAITTLTPAAVTAGHAGFNLIVTGNYFTGNSVVRWNGANLPTIPGDGPLFVSVPASLVTTPGPAAITVATPDGAVSPPAVFTVLPAPVITSLNPAVRTVGTGAFNLTINGTGFTQGSTVQWQSSILTPTSITATQLTVPIPAAFIASGGTAAVRVVSYDGVPSAPATFTIGLLPVITSLNPNNRVAGTAGFTLTVNGTGFSNGATVLWNGAAQPTTFIGATQLSASIPASLIPSPGVASIAVLSADGVSSGPATFNIVAPLRITTPFLPDASPTSPYDGTVTAVGGILPYTWSAIGLPAGLTLNASTGRITGTASSPDGLYNVGFAVSDAGGQSVTAQISLRVKTPVPPLEITTVSLPQATATQSYSGSFGARGGRPDYSFSLAGGSLPDGLSLSFGGTLSGTPGTPGTFTFTVRVNDSAGSTATGTFSLVVVAPPLVITSQSSLGDAPSGTPFNFKFGATGGIPPYRFSGASALPPGLGLSGDGTLSGTPTTVGSYNFRVGVSDSVNTQITKDFSIRITVPTLIIITGSPLPDGQVDEGYQFSFAASGGTPPYSWSAGTLPPGLGLSGAGTLNGTPTTEGSYSLSVTVTDSAGVKTTKSFAVTIIPAKLVITTKSLPGGTVGESYSAGLAATGGVKPYAWSGSGLPDGLSISSSGAVAGTPGTPGTFTAGVSVTDAKGTKTSASFTITIEPAQLVITTGSLPDAVVGTPYSASFAAAGGIPPYTWSGSNLPAGLSLSANGALTGTPAASGPVTLTVTVSDTAGKTANRSYALAPALPPVPPPTFGGISGSAPPGSQSTLKFTLNEPYPADITVVLTMTFAPDTGGDDPAVQFSTGGRTARLLIPAGSTATVTDVGVQSGTVAGLITITASMVSDATNITPTPVPTNTIRINATAPVLSSVTATRTAGGFSVTIVGFSPSREMTQAVFRFSGPATSSLQTTSLTVTIDTLFLTYFQSSAAAPFGSQFVFTQTFTIQGDSQAISSITVTLANKVGTSSAITVNLP